MHLPNALVALGLTSCETRKTSLMSPNVLKTNVPEDTRQLLLPISSQNVPVRSLVLPEGSICILFHTVAASAKAAPPWLHDSCPFSASDFIFEGLQIEIRNISSQQACSMDSLISSSIDVLEYYWNRDYHPEAPAKIFGCKTCATQRREL